MSERRVIIIGGGIGGLALGLTLHQIGVRCSVYESVRNLKPLGVGINLQPNAVRELYELGIGPEILIRLVCPLKNGHWLACRGRISILSQGAALLATTGHNTPYIAVSFIWPFIIGSWTLWVLRHFIQGIVPKVTALKKTAGQALHSKPQLAHGYRNGGFGDRGRRHSFRHTCPDVSRSTADPLGWGVDVARNILGETCAHGILFHGAWDACASHGDLPNLAS